MDRVRLSTQAHFAINKNKLELIFYTKHPRPSWLWCSTFAIIGGISIFIGLIC